MTERAPLLSGCKICIAGSNAIEEDLVMQVRVHLQKNHLLPHPGIEGFN